MTQLNPLSNREKEVVKLLLQGKSNKLIALSLGIAERTVEFHLQNVYAKYQVSSRVELVLKLRESTVDMVDGNVENRGKINPQMDWSSFTSAVSIIGKELIMKVLLKKPSAFLPLAMSLGAFATVIIYVAIFGSASGQAQTDEGTAAHIWQILMAAQIPIIAFFAVKWLPRAPKEALLVLTLQGAAAFTALAPVYLLKF